MYHDAEVIADNRDPMEDTGNEQPQASPREVEEGSGPDFNHTTYPLRKLADQLADRRSIFLGNLHYNSTEPEIREFFESCGVIKRVTIRRLRSPVYVSES